MNPPSSQPDYIPEEDSVKSLQEKLKIAGYWKGPIDGEYTDELKEALRQFQQDHNILESPEVEVDTVKTLQKYTQAHAERKVPSQNAAVVAVLLAVFCVGLGFYAWWNNVEKENELLPSAENFVEKFYKHYNTQDINYIYSTLGGDKLHSQIKYEDFSDFVRKTYDSFGQVNKRERGHWQFDEQEEAVFVIIQYMTLREKQNAMDNIILQKQNNKWSLVGYSVNSDF